MNKIELPALHKDMYYFGYGIDIEKPIDIANKNIELQQENKQLKIQISARVEECNRLESNWNKLKEYMIKEQTRIVIENTDEDEFVYTDLLNKMQEIEKGSDNDE